MTQVHKTPGGAYIGCVPFEEATVKYRLDPNRNLKQQVTINLHLEDPSNAAGEIKRKTEEIRQYFHATYELFEKVYLPINADEAYTIQPKHKLRHPMIFYLGHTATFYLNKLVLGGLTTRINAKYEEQFAIGVDEQSWDDLNTDHYDWPEIEDVWRYRAQLRERIDSLFGKFQLTLPLRFDESTATECKAFFSTLMMAIEHERIHIETASVHVRELPLRLVNKCDFWAPCPELGKAPESNNLVAFEGNADGVVAGRQMDSPVYGWDCDYSDNVRIPVAPFKASEYLVCNAAFLEFVNAGGYQTEKYWDKEGWSWASGKKHTHPWFWVKGEQEGEYRLRVVSEEIPLPMAWPCEVNNLEARAYVNYLSEKQGKTLRLPTEAEWLHMYDECIGAENHWDVKQPGNVNFGGPENWASSCPVNRYKQGKLYDVNGNAWNHTCTPVYPFAGYAVHPYYDDFSMPTFDGMHSSMKGGSWVSTGNASTRDARFAFRRHFFQYIAIRFVEGEAVDESKYGRNILGMDPPMDLAAQRAFQDPPASVDVSPKQAFGKTVADIAKAAFELHGNGQPKARALDLYCGGGRCSFELASEFEQVIGVEFSARLLQAAFAIRERGFADYSTITDGETVSREAVTTKASSFSWAEQREQAFFFQSDPTNLHGHLANFNLVVAFNVLEPPLCLKGESKMNTAKIPSHLLTRMCAGGVLVMVMKKERTDLEGPNNERVIGDLVNSGAKLQQQLTDIQFYLADTKTEGNVVDFQYAIFTK